MQIFQYQWHISVLISHWVNCLNASLFINLPLHLLSNHKHGEKQDMKTGHLLCSSRKICSMVSGVWMHIMHRIYLIEQASLITNKPHWNLSWPRSVADVFLCTASVKCFQLKTVLQDQIHAATVGAEIQIDISKHYYLDSMSIKKIHLVSWIVLSWEKEINQHLTWPSKLKLWLRDLDKTGLKDLGAQTGTNGVWWSLSQFSLGERLWYTLDSPHITTHALSLVLAVENHLWPGIHVFRLWEESGILFTLILGSIDH